MVAGIECDRAGIQHLARVRCRTVEVDARSRTTVAGYAEIAVRDQVDLAVADRPVREPAVVERAGAAVLRIESVGEHHGRRSRGGAEGQSCKHEHAHDTVSLPNSISAGCKVRASKVG